MVVWLNKLRHGVAANRIRMETIMTTRKLTDKGIVRLFAKGNQKTVSYTSLNSQMTILTFIIENDDSTRVIEVAELILVKVRAHASNWKEEIRNQPMPWTVPLELVESIKSAKQSLRTSV